MGLLMIPGLSGLTRSSILTSLVKHEGVSEAALSLSELSIEYEAQNVRKPLAAPASVHTGSSGLAVNSWPPWAHQFFTVRS